MPAILDDMRYALRSMRGNPGFTLVAIASLALGIGVNTAIFSLVDQLLLWSVPARDPLQLVNIEGGRSGTYPFYREYRARNQVFAGMFASSRPVASGVRPEGAAAVEVGHVTYRSARLVLADCCGGGHAGRGAAGGSDTRAQGEPG